MSLDINNQETAYLLGRLFAALERRHETGFSRQNLLHSRYYGTASMTPATVFPVLMQLKTRLNGKQAQTGLAMELDALTNEIMSRIHSFPARLNLLEQGRFAIGYYHQRKVVFQRVEDNLTEALAGVS